MNPPKPSEVSRLIRDWFSNDTTGEFGYDSNRRYQTVGPANRRSPVVFVTKISVLPEGIVGLSATAELGVIAGGGLPTESNLRWMAHMAADAPLLFLGDLDPRDLMIFALLRASLPGNCVSYLGVGDRYLERLSICVPPRFTIPLTASEQDSLSVLDQVLPDLNTLVGNDCYQLLHEQLRKMELEAVVATLGGRDRLFTPLVP